MIGRSCIVAACSLRTAMRGLWEPEWQVILVPRTVSVGDASISVFNRCTEFASNEDGFLWLSRPRRLECLVGRRNLCCSTDRVKRNRIVQLSEETSQENEMLHRTHSGAGKGLKDLFIESVINPIH